MLKQLDDRLLRSPTVILDGTFSRRANRQKVVEFALKNRAQVVQVQCECPRLTARQRVEARLLNGSDPSEIEVQMLDQQAADYESPLEGVSLFTVDSTRPTSEQVRSVLEAVYVKAQAP